MPGCYCSRRETAVDYRQFLYVRLLRSIGRPIVEIASTFHFDAGRVSNWVRDLDATRKERCRKAALLLHRRGRSLRWLRHHLPYTQSTLKHWLRRRLKMRRIMVKKCRCQYTSDPRVTAEQAARFWRGRGESLATISSRVGHCRGTIARWVRDLDQARAERCYREARRLPSLGWSGRKIASRLHYSPPVIMRWIGDIPYQQSTPAKTEVQRSFYRISLGQLRGALTSLSNIESLATR